MLAYAARSHEATSEEYLPRGAGLSKAKLHGVFSHAVVEALKGGASTTAGILASVRQRYAEQARMAPVPLALGDAGATLLPL